ncbi:aldehyde dehydrogenase family protein [Bdellovibrio sp. HCB337]|uniref:aldehyde dehydrogenase family protein n=1 Tax=Bdellovibrio sp. HCB337 TaxID=3394358 RepID=UPI0039A480AC
MSSQEFLNYIDGEFAPASGKSFFPKMNPFNGEVLGNVVASDAMDVIRAIQAAKKAQTELEKWTLEQRAELLEKISQKIAKKADEIAYAEALHQGLSESFVQEKSVQFAIKTFSEAAVWVREFDKKTDSPLRVQPTGIISFILSWNLSLRLLSERLVAALAAGNVCLVKISELSPITGKIFGEILTEVQAPKGLVQLIQGKGSEVGALLAAHPSIRGVNFVGKLANAEKIIQGAIPQFKKIQVHSGVKNNIFVLNEVDFQNKMPEILQSFLVGQGQLCWNSTRIFVLESFQKEFTEKLREYFSSLKPATSPKDASPWTPVVSEEVLSQMEAKSQQIKMEEGKLITGGERAASPGYFFKPTVSLDLPNCSEMQQEEIRGPILILTAVKYQHEMLKWANTTYYAHSAVVWAPNQEKAMKIAEKVEAANVSMNSWFPEECQPGFRQSSFGNMQMGPWGRFYSDVKVLTGL